MSLTTKTKIFKETRKKKKMVTAYKGKKLNTRILNDDSGNSERKYL